MASDLPTEFDVIILGTGMPESIIAGAFSRIGQKVLHIDRNDFYSAEWSAFNLDGLGRLATKPGDSLSHPDIDSDAILKEGEKLQPLELKTLMNPSDLSIEFHIEDSDVLGQEQCSEGNKTAPWFVDEKIAGLSEDFSEKVAVPSGAQNDMEISDIGKSNEEMPQTECAKNVQPDDDRFNDAEESPEQKEKCSLADKELKKTPQESWTASRIKKEWRRFNLDLAPRLLYSAGSMVELLITSDVAKYCEFKTVTRVLTEIDCKLKPVPCSRSDIFNSKDITMAEKRILMKFLMTCMKQEEEDLSGKIGDPSKPFIEFLKSQKLTNKILHYVLYAIAMAKPTDTTIHGLTRVQKFLQSLGRYGNTAFLWPLYGSGELPQSFCRLCAVFGGTYCLRLSASALIIDSSNACTGIVTTQGQRINCKWLIMGASFAPENYLKDKRSGEVSRAILITDGSVLHAEEEELSLLHLPCSEDGDTDNPVTVLELPSSSMACPQGLHVVHLTRMSENVNSSECNLSVAVDALFSKSDQDDKPKMLWSAYFNQKNLSSVKASETVPKNVFLVSGPGSEIDLDCTVSEAKEIFKLILPDEEFLPRPPNPEDIIYVDNEETTVGESISDLDKDEHEAGVEASLEDKPMDVVETSNSLATDQSFDKESGMVEASSKAEVLEKAGGDKETCSKGCNDNVEKTDIQNLSKNQETVTEHQTVTAT